MISSQQEQNDNHIPKETSLMNTKYLQLSFCKDKFCINIFTALDWSPTDLEFLSHIWIVGAQYTTITSIRTDRKHLNYNDECNRSFQRQKFVFLNKCMLKGTPHDKTSSS